MTDEQKKQVDEILAEAEKLTREINGFLKSKKCSVSAAYLSVMMCDFFHSKNNPKLHAAIKNLVDRSADDLT